MWKLQGKIPESFEHIRSDLRVLMEVRPQVVFSLMQVLPKKIIESTSKQTCTWGKEYCEKWGKPDDLSAVLSESSSRYKTAACGITWILAVDQFHILPSTKIPIPNSLCDSLLCKQQMEFRRYLSNWKHRKQQYWSYCSVLFKWFKPHPVIKSWWDRRMPWDVGWRLTVGEAWIDEEPPVPLIFSNLQFTD